MVAPRVSVLMPIYNTQERSLREAIDSILAQTFDDFEFLILNDSPDNERLDQVVQSYSDPRIVYLRNDANIGLERSSNKLLAIARGQYVAVFDHDDISLPQRLAKEVDYLDNHPDVGVVSGQFQVFGIERWTSKNPIMSDDIKAALETASCISHTTAMFRKQVMTDFNIAYEPEFFPAASYRILTRVALVAEVHNLPEVLLRYRMDGNNTSLQFPEERVGARERVRLSYTQHRREMADMTKIFQFSSVVDRTGVAFDNGYVRHYQAMRGDSTFFVKASGLSLAREYDMARLLFDADHNHFIEPVAFHNGASNYLVLEWLDGVSLEAYMADAKTIPAARKRTFLSDLRRISDVLVATNIVHRDIIPRNLMVSGGHLYLTDLYSAVNFDDYRARVYVEPDLGTVGALGESFALGTYRWDDAYSLAKVAEYICGKATEGSADFAEITSRIGERVIEVDMVDVVDYFQHRLATQNTEIADLAVQVARLQPLVDSRTYKIGWVAAWPYRAAKRLRYWLRHH